MRCQSPVRSEDLAFKNVSEWEPEGPADITHTHNDKFTWKATFDCCEMGICKCLYLRLRERGRMAGDLLPSSSVMLSELKCLVRKCSSSAVGWKGNWCSFSWDEHDDCEKQRGRDYKDRRHCIGCPDSQSTAFVCRKVVDC